MLLAAIVALFRPLVAWLPAVERVSAPISWRRFLLATLLPAALVPVLATTLPTAFLPVLVADYLAVHLALYGLVQWLLLRTCPATPRVIDLTPSRLRDHRCSTPIAVAIAVALLVIWGIGVFGLAMDRYAANFMPIAARWPIIAVLCAGTVPFMLADALVSGAGQGRWWRRVCSRLAFMLSLGLAALLEPADLGFLLILLPVLILFFLVHGTMGRWIARQSGPVAAVIGLGLILAWAIGVTFPLFSATTGAL